MLINAEIFILFTFRVVGRDRAPGNDDRANLHYTEAFINETMRFCILTPFLVPHAVVKDTEFQVHSLVVVLYCSGWGISSQKFYFLHA